jgi:hypothetical protein
LCCCLLAISCSRLCFRNLHTRSRNLLGAS